MTSLIAATVSGTLSGKPAGVSMPIAAIVGVLLRECKQPRLAAIIPPKNGDMAGLLAPRA